MKKLSTLILMLLIGIGNVLGAVDTQVIKVSTAANPEHVYFMHAQNNDYFFATSNAYASNSLSNAAKFAFIQAKDGNNNVIENAYYIYCVDTGKWMSYDKSGSYSVGKGFVKMVGDDPNYFCLEYVTTAASSTKGYRIRPYYSNGNLPNIYLNWYEGAGSNTGSSIGLWTGDASADAGSGWAFTEVPQYGRYYRIKSCYKEAYLGSNTVSSTVDNSTLYYYSEKGLMQVSSGLYYDCNSINIGTIAYPVTIHPNTTHVGALSFKTNNYWLYRGYSSLYSHEDDDSGNIYVKESGLESQKWYRERYGWYFEEVDVIMPEVGKTYAIMGVADKHNFIVAENSTSQTNHLKLTQSPEDNSYIFTLRDGGILQSYTNGRYLVNDNGYLKLGDANEAGTAIEFVATQYGGAFYLKYTDNSKTRYAYSNKDGYIDGGGSTGSDEGYQWVVVEVDPSIPVGHNAYTGDKSGTVDAIMWKNKSNWRLFPNQSWNVGPGYTNSNMWAPIYLKDVTATATDNDKVIKFEGWNLRLNLENSNLAAEAVKLQPGTGAAVTIDVDETSELSLEMTGSNADPGLHTFNIDGKMALKTKSGHFTGTSDNQINLGTTGAFTLTADNSLSIESQAGFTVNASLENPATANTLVERMLAIFSNVTVNGLQQTVINGTDGWTKLDDKGQFATVSSVGKYYCVEQSTTAGVKLYTANITDVSVPITSCEVRGDITSSTDFSDVVNTGTTSVDLSNAVVAEGSEASVISNIKATANANILIYAPEGFNAGESTNIVVKSGNAYTCGKLVLTDKVPFKTPKTFTATSAEYERTVAGGSTIGTLCLPYTYVKEDGTTYYTIDQESSSTSLIKLEEVNEGGTTVPANTPVIYVKGGEITKMSLAGSNAEVSSEMSPIGTFQLRGVYQEQTWTSSESAEELAKIYVVSGDKFKKSTSRVTLKPFRAYLYNTSVAEARSSINFSFDADATGISETSFDNDAEVEGFYTLGGQRVRGLQKGAVTVIRYSNDKSLSVMVK